MTVKSVIDKISSWYVVTVSWPGFLVWTILKKKHRKLGIVLGIGTFLFTVMGISLLLTKLLELIL